MTTEVMTSDELGAPTPLEPDPPSSIIDTLLSEGRLLKVPGRGWLELTAPLNGGDPPPLFRASDEFPHPAINIGTVTTRSALRTDLSDAGRLGKTTVPSSYHVYGFNRRLPENCY